MVIPHDYVADPVPSVPVHSRGHATLDELFEVFADNRGVPLVGREDPAMGPYTHCIRVDAADVVAYLTKGFRPLAASEQDAIFVTPDDFGDATD
jgi:hypothetical protein